MTGITISRVLFTIGYLVLLLGGLAFCVWLSGGRWLSIG